MANKPLRPCRHPGCTALVSDGYCDLHRPKDRRSAAAKSWHWMYLTPVFTDRSNLQSLCHSCHSRKTMAEMRQKQSTLRARWRR